MSEIQTEKLRQLVKGCGKSQTQISAETGVAQASLSRFLKGEQSSFSGDNLLNLFDLVGIRLVFPGQNVDLLTLSACPRCQELEDENKILKARCTAFLEAISAQAAAQSKVEIDQRPQLQALASGHAS